LPEQAGAIDVPSSLGESGVSNKPKKAATGKEAEPIFRCDIDGKTVYANAPCNSYPSAEVTINESSGVTIVDAREVEKFRTQALAPKPVTQPKAVVGVLARASPDRDQCD